MRKSIYIIVLFVGLVLMASGCKKNNVKPSNEALLTDHSWNLVSATVDGQPVDLYNGLTLSFTETSYTSTNGGSLWSASGTWQWKDSDQVVMVRDDGLEVNIEEISETELILGFIWPETIYDGGREESTQGAHRMVFSD